MGDSRTNYTWCTSEFVTAFDRDLVLHIVGGLRCTLLSQNYSS